jgi:hypothetical protein
VVLRAHDLLAQHFLKPHQEQVQSGLHDPVEGGSGMNWARMLAYITGTVDQELLLRNEYLVHRQYSVGSTISRRQKLNRRVPCSELAFVESCIVGALRLECRNPNMHFPVLPLSNSTEAEPDCPEHTDRRT